MQKYECPNCFSRDRDTHRDGCWAMKTRRVQEFTPRVDVTINNTPAATGMKFDGGKPRFSLLRFGCARALLGIAKVLTFGARKYAAHSWRDVDEGIDRYWSSYERHMNRIAIYGLDSRDLNENGEVDENHSGELDIDHANTNGLFLAELIRKQYGIKD